MCLVTDATQLVTATRRRLWAEHLGCDETELGGERVEVIDERWPRSPKTSSNGRETAARPPSG